MQHRVVTGLFGGGSSRASRGGRSARGGGGGRGALALSLTCLAILLATAAGLLEQLLLLAGDVELNPGPVSHKSLSEGQARLVTSAPAEVREVLTAWDPVKATVRADIQSLSLPKLRTAVAWLYNMTEDSPKFKKLNYHNCKKEKLSLAVLLGLERLLPEECGVCLEEYSVPREETPVLQCKGCLQGFHAACLGPVGLADIAGLPGELYWLCPRCKDCYVLKTEVGGGEGPRRPQERRRGKCAKPPPRAPAAAAAGPGQEGGGEPEGEPLPPGEEPVLPEQRPEEPDLRPDCPSFLTGECAFGVRGRRGEETCPLPHRKRCPTFMRWGDRGNKGCKKNPCDKVHPTVCEKSLDLECLDRDCQARIHVQRCRRPPPPARGVWEDRGGGRRVQPDHQALPGHRGGGPGHRGRGYQGQGPDQPHAARPGPGQWTLPGQGQPGAARFGPGQPSATPPGPAQPAAVWQKQQPGFDAMTVQQMLEAYMMNLWREMMERQADLARLVREEMAMLRVEGRRQLPLHPFY
jgi:hypothetical protein